MTFIAKIFQSLALVVGAEVLETAISTSERPLKNSPSGVNGSSRIVITNRFAAGS